MYLFLPLLNPMAFKMKCHILDDNAYNRLNFDYTRGTFLQRRSATIPTQSVNAVYELYILVILG